MRIRPSLKTGLLDFLVGSLGLVLVLLLAFGTRMKFDLRWLFSIAALFCCALGFLRGQGSPLSPWLRGLLVSAGFSLPIVTLSLAGMAFNAVEIAAALVLVAAISVYGGVYGRRAWRCQQRIAAVLFSMFPLACVVLGSVLLLPTLMAKLSSERVNLPAPEFSLTTDDGQVLTSSAMRGKVVVLAFWATWCQPCWQELPRVEKVYASYRNNQSVRFWAVNARAGGDTDEMARAYSAKMRLALPLAYTENANAARLGVGGYPALVLLDSTGHLRFIHHGYDASEPLESNLAHEIASLLN